MRQCPASNDSNEHDLKALFAVHNRIKMAKHRTKEGISCFNNDDTYKYYEKVKKTDRKEYKAMLTAAIDSVGLRELLRRLKDKEMELLQQINEVEKKRVAEYKKDQSEINKLKKQKKML